MLITGNIKFFCESCQNYIDKREEYFHANDCPGNKFKKMTFSTELDRNENSNYFKKNESKNDHYNMKDGLMTFGRTNQRLNDNIQVDNQFSSSKSQFNKDEFSDTFKRKDFKYDTLKNFNSNDNMDNFKQSGALKQIDQFSSSKQNFKDFHDPYSTTGTFLRKQNPFLQIQSSIKEYDENDKIIKDEKYSYINIRRNDIKDIIGAVGLSNSGIENNSFLNVVIQCLWNMKAFRNFLLSDFNISENDLKYKILSNLKNIFKNYSKSINIKGKIVEIEKLRQSLSEQFQSRRKFLPEHSDDPVDVLFVFLNCFHSFFIKSVANEISEESCNFECISHQLFWIDLYRLDECECGASSKKMFSYHNYMFDIPFDKIFECLEKLQTPELNKRIKLKSGKLNSDNNNNNNIADFKGKLFNCLKNQLSQIKINCPSGRCSNNETKKTYILSNLPTFFMINLQNKNIFNNSALDVLKSFLLIPGLFDISTIFEYSNQKKKIFYEFLGGIFSNNNHSFNAFFIQQNEWIHYCDEKISHYKNWYEFILEMIKKQEMPMFLIFQKQENYDEVNLNLLHDDILKLERYARNIDSIPQIMINKFRPYEDISKIDTISVFENMSPTQEHNKFKRVSKADQIESYNCSICNYKNKIDNIICVKCNKNNEIVINKLINNKKNENLPLSSDYTKPSINTIETSSKTNNFFNNPIKNSNFESYSKGFHNKNENDNNLYNNKNDIKEIIKANDTPQFPEEKNKNLNLPKQIHTKENNLKTKENNLQTTITKLSNCNECSKLTEKCICKKYKENFNNDNQTVIKIEDKNKKTNFNDWECENCRFINQISNTNCKLCKSSNKPSIQQSTTMNSRDIFPTPNNINSQNSKRSPEKTIPKNIELINNSVGGKNPQAFIKEINISQNKCICNVIDNDSLFTNNICRLCKKPRPEKNIKQQPKKIITNYTEDKNSKEIQQVSIVSNLTPSKTQMTKTNSKEKTNFTELKRLEVKKGQFDINDSRNSKNLNNQIKPNSNLKSNLNFKEMSSESNNPFKKTSYVNAQVANHGNNRNSKDVEIKQNNSNNNYNLKNTISKQKLNDNSHQKFK